MISIIVPVYNVEKYLNQCVQSILGQTYQDFELLLVDDGSSDNSGQMCDDYAERDSRVKVIHKENGGLSDARNKGTELARGEYITYVDSDDYVREDYLETLRSLMDRSNADIAVTGIEKFYDGDALTSEPRDGERRVMSGIEALFNVLYQKDMDTSACAMLLKTDIAYKNPFPVRKYHEDDFTTYKYYLSAKRVAVSNQKQYYYRQRKGSIMHSFGQASLDELDAGDHIVEYCEQSCVKLINAAKSKQFSNYCQVLLSIPPSEIDVQTYLRILNLLKENRKSILLDKNARKKNRFAAFILYFGPSTLRTINLLLKKCR